MNTYALPKWVIRNQILFIAVAAEKCIHFWDISGAVDALAMITEISKEISQMRNDVLMGDKTWKCN